MICTCLQHCLLLACCIYHAPYTSQQGLAKAVFCAPCQVDTSALPHAESFNHPACSSSCRRAVATHAWLVEHRLGAATASFLPLFPPHDQPAGPCCKHTPSHTQVTLVPPPAAFTTRGLSAPPPPPPPTPHHVRALPCAHLTQRDGEC